MKYILPVLCGLLFLSDTVLAEDNKSTILGNYDSWTAYLYQDAQDPENKVCYIAAEPTKSTGKYKKRDDVFLFITHHAKEKLFDKVNVMAGYTYKKGSKPSLTVDKNKAIMLQPTADSAWTKDGESDQKLVSQMQRGSTAVLRGASVRGTATTDTFSLKGFSKAYRDIQKACGRN